MFGDMAARGSLGRCPRRRTFRSLRFSIRADVPFGQGGTGLDLADLLADSAHRFDEAIVMSHGRVVAQGAPATLAALSTDFAQLLASYRKEGTQNEVAA